ncbi:MAG TPA: RHS repeat-associated core domain-containing protein, partial [Ktedonobacterales bacterium]
VEQYVSGGSGNHTYYLPGNAEEVTPSNTLVKYYAAGGLSLGLNTTTNGSGISYLVSDGLGSVSEALNQTGTATGGVLYGPYGGVRYSTGTLPTAKGFTGQYSDASTGLDYYGARYYDPQLGQFTSADTVADGLNRYGYVKGNPETATDPTGHRTDDGFHDGGSSSGEINEADWVWHTRTGGEQFNMRQQIAACRADPTGCDLWSAAAFNYTPFDNRRWNEARHMWGLDDPEWDAAIGLENYFGLQIMLNSQSPAKGSGGGTNPDYTMGIATMVATPGTWPGVGMAIKYGTNLELYTPTGDNEGNIIAEIGRKGADYGKKAQAPIVVVDVDKSSVFNGMDSNALTTWGSTKIGSKGPYRIIFMRNNTVVADVGNWGPDAYGRGDIA